MIKKILNKLSRKEDLSNQEMQDVVNHIMCGEVEDNDIESFLLALNEKGIQEPEITAAATVMREKSLKFDIGDGTHIDTCGTCLLYTSPSPRDQRGSRMPSSA